MKTLLLIRISKESLSESCQPTPCAPRDMNPPLKWLKRQIATPVIRPTGLRPRRPFGPAGCAPRPPPRIKTRPQRAASPSGHRRSERALGPGPRRRLARPLPSAPSAHFIRKEKRARGREVPPPPPPSGSASARVTPGQANSEARYCEVGRARTRSGRWVGAAAPPLLGHHRGGAAAPTDAREPSLALPTSSSRSPRRSSGWGVAPSSACPVLSLRSSSTLSHFLS